MAQGRPRRATPPGGLAVYGWGDNAISRPDTFTQQQQQQQQQQPVEQPPRFFKTLLDKRGSTSSNTPDSGPRVPSTGTAATAATRSSAGYATISARPSQQHFTEFCRSLSDKFKW